MKFKYTTCEDRNRCIMDSDLFGTQRVKTTNRKCFLNTIWPSLFRMRRTTCHASISAFLRVCCVVWGAGVKGFSSMETREKQSKVASNDNLKIATTFEKLINQTKVKPFFKPILNVFLVSYRFPMESRWPNDRGFHSITSNVLWYLVHRKIVKLLQNIICFNPFSIALWLSQWISIAF